MKLFKIDSKGKVRVWEIETSSNSESYRTITGILHGKSVTSDWTKCEPKNIGKSNETSSSEQCLSEVQSLIQKKKDKGYAESVENIKPLFKPMLAQTFKSFEDIEKRFPDSQLFAQPKLDGIRCVINKDGMWTRNMKPINSCPHIFEEVFNSQIFDMFPDAYVDGELYNHDFKDNFNEICSIVKREKLTEDDLKKSKEFMQFHIYDISINQSFSSRNSHIIDFFQDLQYIKLLPTEFVFKSDDIAKYYAKHIEDGYEGQMIRIDGVPYENKRSFSLLKHKSFIDEEFEIVSILSGKGNWQNAAKVVNCKIGNEIFGTGLKCTMSEGEQILKDAHQYIGGLSTVTYFEKTPDGIPRFGISKYLTRKNDDRI